METPFSIEDFPELMRSGDIFVDSRPKQMQTLLMTFQQISAADALSDKLAIALENLEINERLSHNSHSQ